MSDNQSLIVAAKAKKDKFYTQLEDIENELRHYREFFKGKRVLCNCDDPFESNFFQYFALKFNDLELKKLVTTSYADSPIAGLEISLFPDGKTAYMTEVTELRDWNGDGREDLNDVKFAIEHGLYKVTPLTGDLKYCAGDFRSKELVDLLKACDVVVTNPPFSVFREFVKLMIDSGKKFIIIGNVNAITYKEIFPLLMSNKLWFGESIHSGDREFRVPDDYPLEAANFRVDENGIKYLRIKGVRWYTNFDISKFREDIPLFKSYREEPERYPRYDNYDAIEVSKTAHIPCDYDGVMGVPITFLDKYNPNQFEILGNSEMFAEPVTVNGKLKQNPGRFYINGKRMYDRILIRRRQ